MIRLFFLGCSKSHFWDRVLCWLAGKYYWSVWQGMHFLVSLIQRPSLFPDTGLLEFGFKLIIIVLWRSMHILFTDRVLPTIRCRDQIRFLQEEKVLPYSVKIMIQKRFYFVIQIPLFTDLQYMQERSMVPRLRRQFTSSAEWCGNHSSVFSLCAYTDAMNQNQNIYCPSIGLQGNLSYGAQ